MEFLTSFAGNLGEYFTTKTLMSGLRFVILIFICLPLVYLFSNWIRKYLTKKFTSQQAMLAGKLVFYSGLFIIFFSILSELGFKLTHLIGAAGIVGIAVGFASQTSVSNIISGLFLIAEKPFQVDDIITVQGITGIVLSIDTLSVKLRTFDNKYVRIPNETIIKSDVTNVTHFPIRRMDIKIGVAYKEDIGRVREILLDVAKHNPLCLNEPEPLVLFLDFGNSSLDLQFSIWLEKSNWLQLKNSITEEIKLRFDREDIEIPFPHITVYTGSVTEPLPIRVINEGIKT